MDGRTSSVRSMSANSELLALYRDAEKRILAGQEVRFGERFLRQADLQVVQAERRRLEAVVAAEERAAGGQIGPRVMVADFSRSLG